MVTLTSFCYIPLQWSLEIPWITYRDARRFATEIGFYVICITNCEASPLRILDGSSC